MLVAGAVEVENDAPGRLRLAGIKDFPAASLHGFVAVNVAPGATIKTDGWPSYARAPTSGTAPSCRRHDRPCRSALGPPRLLQRQDLGARRLSWTAKTASPELPR